MKHKVKLEPLGIELNVNHNALMHDVVADYGIEFPCAGTGRCGNCKIKILQGNIQVVAEHEELLQKKGLSKQWRLACYSKVTEDITVYIGQCDHLIQSDESLFSFHPEPGYGIAVDLGSTTIVSQLVNLQTGQIESVAMDMNPQSRFGADVISRISYAMQSESNRAQLCNIVRYCVAGHIYKLSAKTDDLRRVVIVGNTVMHHFFCDLDVSPLATYPFQSPHNRACLFQPHELGWNTLPDGCVIHFMPNISHFIGSDILAGIYATNIQDKEEYQILLDLGTNGEIVVGNKNRILCTSTAAGPAFEGISISQGMRASSGAINQIEVGSDHALQCNVIGNTEAAGICGSGLVDAVYHLLKKEIIDFTGAMSSEGMTFVPLINQIGVTDRDIREFQLAKAAVCAGLQLLLNKLNITIAEVKHVYIAGGLGNYIHVGRAMEIGLLELENEQQLIKVNNSALTGAKMMLFSGAEQDIRQILKITEHCTLETESEFQDLFCDKIFFPYS